MTASPKNIIVFIYNSYKDPLFQNLLLEYIKTLSENENVSFDLITYEQEEYQLKPQEIKKEELELSKFNIAWHPLKFHTGRFLLFKKAYDVVQTIWLISRIKIRKKPEAIFSFANVASSIAVLLSRLFRIKLIIYSYEPHSEFMMELGIWKKTGLSFRILNSLERMAGKKANYIMTGTKFGVDYLKSLGSKARIFRAPTAVNPDRFNFSLKGRERVRAKLEIDKEPVVIYIGKFGTLYYEEQIIEVFGTLLNLNPNYRFIVVTSFEHAAIREWMRKFKIPQNSYSLASNLSSEEIRDYLSAADMGISAVPPSPSQKFRSPTKVAEYLLCGLPYITCKGVSEDDEYAIKENVGVVLDNFSSDELQKNYSAIQNLLGEDQENLRSRCRKVGLEYRSKKRIDDILSKIVQVI